MSPTVITSTHLKRYKIINKFNYLNIMNKIYFYRKRKSYMGDFHETDLNSPGKRKRYWQISQNSYSSLRHRNKLLLSQNLAMKREITNFRQLTNHLKNKNKIAENCFAVLKVRKELGAHELLLENGFICKLHIFPKYYLSRVNSRMTCTWYVLFRIYIFRILYYCIINLINSFLFFFFVNVYNMQMNVI